ncbi:hypothetical protein N0V83_007316 [Neocucurbitaria cava]|uniref:AAA+ ATPase domain-containing protein n=1 Tax=Neocucurbitaria cava TaxID=798079 RepID=A0A9W8Y348_9PLEO|nr:hypothetical protein N0V83_007316 [Neocucurbitaria cava]
MKRLEKTLFSEDEPPRVAITGLGGVGKTQIALELAYRAKARHPGCSVFWIPATNPESLQLALREVGQQLRIPGINDKQANVKKLVQRHLSQEDAGQWLLIIDNVDDVNMWNNELRAHLPNSHRGCVVCTTRSLKVATEIAVAPNVIEVSAMDESMAMRMLGKLLIDHELLAHNHDARELLERLIFLPLAIAQAAAYINRNKLTLSHYLNLMNEQEDDVIELLSEDFEDQGRYQDAKNPIATTWMITFEQIQQTDSLAAEYLSFMACIDPKDVPLSLLPPATSEKAMTDAIGTLSAYSFVTRRVADTALEVHRLVHLATRNWLKSQDWLEKRHRLSVRSWFNSKKRLKQKTRLCAWTDKAMARLAEVVPLKNHHEIKVWKAYLPHARYIISCTTEEKQINQRTELRQNMAQCLRFEGRYTEAENILLPLVENLKQVVGENYEWTLDCTNDLAWLYYLEGRYEDAENLNLRVIKVGTSVCGVDHAIVLRAKSSLALFYSQQGRWKEAEELQLNILDTYLRMHGEEHHDTLITKGSLARTYYEQERWKEAEELQLKVLEISSRVLDEEHPDTLIARGNLARTYYKQGRWKEAEELDVKVLETRSRVLSEEHPATLVSMFDLAGTYYKQKRWKEAEKLEVKALEISLRVLGEEHFDTLTFMDHLAITYSSQERWEEAEKLDVKALEIRLRVLGEEHPKTLSSMHDLACTLYGQSRRGSAVSLMEKCYQIRERVLGAQHDGTLGSLKWLEYLRREDLDECEKKNIERDGEGKSDHDEGEDMYISR